MSDHLASPLATAFLWAISAAAVYGGFDILTHEKPTQINNDLCIAVPLAAVVSYSSRKSAP